MGYQNVVRDKMETMGLTTREAAQRCDISAATMSVLEAGYRTLPSLALKVAAGLGLTTDEAEQIGQALDKKRWQLNVETKATGIDFDPMWAQKQAPTSKQEQKPKRKRWDRAQVPHLDIRAVSEWAAGRMTSANEICRAATGFNASEVTGTRLRDGNKRQELINQVAAAMGLEPEEITITGRVPTARENRDVMYWLRLEDLIDGVEATGKTTARLCRENGESPNFLSTVVGRARKGEAFLPETCRRVAKVMQMGYYELFEPIWRDDG